MVKLSAIQVLKRFHRLCCKLLMTSLSNCETFRMNVWVLCNALSIPHHCQKMVGATSQLIFPAGINPIPSAVWSFMYSNRAMECLLCREVVDTGVSGYVAAVRAVQDMYTDLAAGLDYSVDDLLDSFCNASLDSYDQRISFFQSQIESIHGTDTQVRAFLWTLKQHSHT